MNFSLLFAALALLAAVLALLAHWGWTAWRRAFIGDLRFVRKTFLTPNEVDFYHRLLRAVHGDFVIMAQVSMGALIDTTLKQEHPKYWEVRQLFGARICDFVLCDTKSLQPLLIIELDDKMHDFARDEHRDSFIAQAGMATIRFWSRNKPQPAELRSKILKKLGRA